MLKTLTSAALFAALAEGESEVANYPDSGVTRAMRGALASLGVPSRLADGVLRVEGNGLRPPFMALNGGGEAAAQSIADERDKEPFMSQEDISIRCGKASSAVIQSLRDIGALGDLPESNQLDLFAAMF